jgi:cation:H+ antiporter
LTLPILFLLIGIIIILASCEIFVNAVEWLGKRLGLGEGAVGSILAAVGTAMPETMIPIIAIVFMRTEASNEIGVGAILGAPFLLSTFAFFMVGSAVLGFSATGRRSPEMKVNTIILSRDMKYFLMVYSLAIAATFIPIHPLKLVVAFLLLGLYGYYVFRTLHEPGMVGVSLNPLYFSRATNPPHLAVVLLQFFAALGGIILGARVFVVNLEHIALEMGVSALVLSLLIAPWATELPEKFNSILWVRRGKDTLAMGNISGAMVFQSTIPVAIGIALTPWELSPPALASALIALASTTIVFSSQTLLHRLSPRVLLLGFPFWLLFVLYVVFFT